MTTAGKQFGANLRRGSAILAAVAATFAAGYLFAFEDADADATSFHDMRVVSLPELTGLIDPESHEIRGLARRLGTPEQAYRYVRDGILYDPSVPLAPPTQTLAAKEGSCLSKAALLASLYRALGMAHEQVRVVTGLANVASQPMEHAWLEIEYGGRCFQQDPTTLLGSFEFDEFANTDFTRAFIHREYFCFNDKGFAVVSLSNKFRGGVDPHLQLADEMLSGEGPL